MRLARQRLAKGVEDPGGLEDRPVADIRAEDLRRVRGLTGDRQRPGRRPSAADDRASGIAGAILESDRHVHALRCRNQRGAGHILRIAGCLLVTGHHDRHVHAVERASGVERLQRLDDDDVAPLHVDDPGAAGLALVQALEFLKRAVGLEHRIEVTDEEETTARPRPLRDQMAGALERRSVDPAGREAQAVELGREHLPYLAHAGKVLCPAIDVDGSFEERQGFGVVGIHVSDDRAFVGRQSCGSLTVSPRHEQHRNCGGNEPAEGHDLILARPGEPSVPPLVPYT